MQYLVRPATRADAPAFLRLVEELARFEKLDPPDASARERLVEDAFGERPRIQVLAGLAPGGEVAAYAILCETYSSFLARPTLYLEDLYVTPAHRASGLAQEMLRAIGRAASDRGCGRIEGVVLGWNGRARRFYAKTGARELTEWVFFRYDDAAIRALR